NGHVSNKEQGSFRSKRHLKIIKIHIPALDIVLPLHHFSRKLCWPFGIASKPTITLWFV
ncbi:hypothetical protein PanWU01x14_046920, partial [Parasponia andersonii]